MRVTPPYSSLNSTNTGQTTCWPRAPCPCRFRLRRRRHRLGEQLLQLGVLIFKRLQTLGVRDIEAAVLGLPFVERRAADPTLAAHIGRLRTGLLLPQNPNDLLFREPAWLHVHPLNGDGLHPFLEEIAGLSSSFKKARSVIGLMGCV